ncbi:MarR family transcriptional regulator [Snodgrassella alvi]|uniref:MarR family transcriptional regulator n=1 Tax=Snodgrassella alvi TaxID=1196083 RepID=UPI000D78AEA5|nr:MarR family transcriptional regulator [Snodgrassella alvi]PXY98532.1 MarR family transcriptional regulator [Snodgrassella alvi]
MGFSLPATELEATLGVLAVKMPSMNVQLVMLSRLIRLVHTSIHGELNERLHKHHLSESLWHALLAVYSRPNHEILPSELSSILNLTRTSATRLSDELVLNGWATRSTHPYDRRKITLKLTKAGEDLIQTVSPETNEVHRRVWSALSEPEYEQLQQLLTKLLTAA